MTKMMTYIDVLYVLDDPDNLDDINNLVDLVDIMTGSFANDD